MVVQEKLINATEFHEITALSENANRRLELVEGVIIEMPGSRPINTLVAHLVSYHLNAFVLPRDLGFVVGIDSEFKLDEYTVRLPDVAFVACKNCATMPDKFDHAPDLAVEIVSPREDALKKAYEYLRAGTKIVWSVYPDIQVVHVFRLAEDGNPSWRVYRMDDVLSGEDVLPGFDLPVSTIFTKR